MQGRAAGAPHFSNILRDSQHTSVTYPEPFREASPVQDEAGALQKRHLQKLPSDWPAEADPDEEEFLLAQTFVLYVPANAQIATRRRLMGVKAGGHLLLLSWAAPQGHL